MKKKVIVNYPLFLFIIANIFSFILLFYFFKNNFSNYIIIQTILFIGLLWFPYLISKVVGIQIPKFICQLYLLVIFLDLLLGKVLMFEKIIYGYNYLILLIQGIVFYIFGLWVVKFLDDYGFFSYKLITIFSLLFALSLNVGKELLFYIIILTFKISGVTQMLYLLISSIACSFMYILLIIDSLYYKNKYYNILEKKLNKI